MKTAYPYEPVPERGTLTCFVLALLMHLLLGALLYYGVHWHSTAPAGVEAELWEPTPEIAAQTEPEVQPVQAAKPVEEEEADISLQEKARQAEAAAREQALAKQREAQAREEAARKEAQRKATEAQVQREAANKAERRSELARLQAQAGSAGAAGAGTGTGSSARPSSGYADRVRQRVKPNIIFTGEVSGNPEAVVAVRMAPDGSLLSARLAKSSGNSDWDNAVLRAVSRSDPLPRDQNGVAPASITITFRPKDQGG